MNNENKASVDITSEEAKKSEFLKEFLDFGDYQKGEVMKDDTHKAFLLIAIDGDMSSDNSNSLAVATLGGDKKELFTALVNYLREPSGIRDELHKAMTAVALEHIINHITGGSNE